MAAFANAEGEIILIGVADKRRVNTIPMPMKS